MIIEPLLGAVVNLLQLYNMDATWDCTDPAAKPVWRISSNSPGFASIYVCVSDGAPIERWIAAVQRLELKLRR
jgi:hypothetical protein